MNRRSLISAALVLPLSAARAEGVAPQFQYPICWPDQIPGLTGSSFAMAMPARTPGSARAISTPARTGTRSRVRRPARKSARYQPAPSSSPTPTIPAEWSSSNTRPTCSRCMGTWITRWQSPRAIRSRWTAHHRRPLPNRRRRAESPPLRGPLLPDLAGGQWGDRPRYGFACGVNCPPGPGYWPIDAPENPSAMGWRNPTHVIAHRMYSTADPPPVEFPLLSPTVSMMRRATGRCRLIARRRNALAGFGSRPATRTRC